MMRSEHLVMIALIAVIFYLLVKGAAFTPPDDPGDEPKASATPEHTERDFVLLKEKSA